jgi:adenine-specific DNA-methyltransferase
VKVPPPYIQEKIHPKALKTRLKAEINRQAWETLMSATSRPFPKPKSGRIAVKVINYLGDEVMKVFKV